MFTLPNAENPPTYQGQAVPDSTDLAALADGIDGIGVVSGCQVHASGGFTLSVDPGSIRLAGPTIPITGGTPTAPTGYGSDTTDRRDIVVVDSSGNLSIVKGQPCTVVNWNPLLGGIPPVKPAVPGGSVLLAELYLPGGASAITPGMIIDKTTVVQGPSGAGPVTQISSLTAMGHSWSVGINSTDESEWQDIQGVMGRIAGILGIESTSLLDLGTSGAFLTNGGQTDPQDAGWSNIFQFVVPTTQQSRQSSATAFGDASIDLPIFQNPGAYFLLFGVNDVLLGSPSWASVGLTAWSSTLEAVIARLQAGILFGSWMTQGGGVSWDSSISTSGWTVGTWLNGSGPSYLTTSTNGSTVTVTLPQDFAGGWVDVCLVGGAGSGSVTWSTSGSNASITGTQQVNGFNLGGHYIPVVGRFLCTRADAGTTITATVSGLSSSSIIFDSWWIESSAPPPIVVCNVPRWCYANIWIVNDPFVTTPAQNAATASVVAQFGGNVQLADLDAIWYPRSAVLASSLNTSATSCTVTAHDPAFTNYVGQGTRICVGGTEEILVTGISGTFPNYTLTLTRAYNNYSGPYGPSNPAVAHSGGEWIGDGSIMSTDGVHPNAAGAGLVAECAYDAFATAMASMNSEQLSLIPGKPGTPLSTTPGEPAIFDNSYLYPPAANLVSSAPTLNLEFAFPIYIPNPCILVGAGVEVTATHVANLRVGIFVPDEQGGRPGRLLRELGPISLASSGAQLTTGTTWQLLRPGWYWVGSVMQGSAAASVRMVSGSSRQTQTTAAVTGYAPIAYELSGVSGTLVAAGPWTAWAPASQHPYVFLNLRAPSH